MRLNQFIDKLSMTPRRWYLVEGRRIRMRIVGAPYVDCPISAGAKAMGIGGSEYGEGLAFTLGVAMGLSRETTRRVIAAADAEGYPTLRRRLLCACGLTRTGVPHGD